VIGNLFKNQERTPEKACNSSISPFTTTEEWRIGDNNIIERD